MTKCRECQPAALADSRHSGFAFPHLNLKFVICKHKFNCTNGLDKFISNYALNNECEHCNTEHCTALLTTSANTATQSTALHC